MSRVGILGRWLMGNERGREGERCMKWCLAERGREGVKGVMGEVGGE